jgi:hypothetical protein
MESSDCLFISKTFKYGCQESYKRCVADSTGMVNCGSLGIPGYYKTKIVFSFLNYLCMLTILLLLAGLICFWLFYKATDWFENI